MKITTKSQYGLRALIFLAKCSEDCCSVTEIAKANGISKNYLEKIFSKMEKAGFIKGKRGVGGGYVLAKPLKKITVKDFLQALEGETVPVHCVSGLKCPLSKKCDAKNVWSKVKKEVESTLDKMSLEDLI